MTNHSDRTGELLTRHRDQAQPWLAAEPPLAFPRQNTFDPVLRSHVADMQKLVLFKIFYNAASRSQIEPDYIPLDNTDGPPDWFEMWPILRYIETHDLEDDAWYGFFSPKFPAKALQTLSDVKRLIEANPAADVALFSYDWPTLISFRNAFVQGEDSHPGLISCMETFLASRGEKADLRHLIGDFETSVFSNYVVAKKAYWLEWAALARAYHDYATTGGPSLPDNAMTVHDLKPVFAMRVFVQERLACWILSKGRYRVVHPNYARDVSFDRYITGTDSPWLRRTLGMANAAKRLARRSNMPSLMVLHWLAMRANGVVYRLRVMFKG